MLKPEQIPDEVAKAVMHCFHTRNAAKSAIAAAINAWPGGEWRESGHYPHGIGGPDATVTTRLILPLPQEARDE